MFVLFVGFGFSWIFGMYSSVGTSTCSTGSFILIQLYICENSAFNAAAPFMSPAEKCQYWRWIIHKMEAMLNEAKTYIY